MPTMKRTPPAYKKSVFHIRILQYCSRAGKNIKKLNYLTYKVVSGINKLK